jgi:hypothetical protein
MQSRIKLQKVSRHEASPHARPLASEDKLAAARIEKKMARMLTVERTEARRAACLLLGAAGACMRQGVWAKMGIPTDGVALGVVR